MDSRANPSGGGDAVFQKIAGVRGLPIVLALGLAIRVYLSLTSYCISGDGVAYLGMARAFAVGDWRRATGPVFSPLYPLLTAVIHLVAHDWEVAGNLVSVLMGTAAIGTVYLMTDEAFARSDLALGAALLAAIHPELAGYSASVRTEAGYIFFMTGSIWLLLKATREGRVATAALAGIVAGLAYLYRTEAVGLLIFVVVLLPFAAFAWRREPPVRDVAAASVFAAAFVITAAPYLVLVRVATGHWAVSREFTAAMMYGIGGVSANGEAWRKLGFSASVSPFAPLFADPKLYLEKMAGDFVRSFYNFEQALGLILTTLLIVGLWMRRGRLLAGYGETFLALLIGFYFCGFAFSYTGARFMVHLIPYAFGWVMLGLEACSGALSRAASVYGWRLPQGALAIAIVLILLPQTLWPIGYDMRGIRYAGEDIARRVPGEDAVVGRDGRVAYYAGTRFIALPTGPMANLCNWLEAQDRAGYLLIGDSDERRLDIGRRSGCIEHIERYPRYGVHYYDLYAVRRPGAASR